MGLTAIFGWQATQGAHGLIMRERRKTELAQAEANLVAARVERDMWQRKVAGLTPSHLDRDALDQRLCAWLAAAGYLPAPVPNGLMATTVT